MLLLTLPKLGSRPLRLRSISEPCARVGGAADLVHPRTPPHTPMRRRTQPENAVPTPHAAPTLGADAGPRAGHAGPVRSACTGRPGPIEPRHGRWGAQGHARRADADRFRQVSACFTAPGGLYSVPTCYPHVWEVVETLFQKSE